jgi:hypothetical protein
MSAFTQVQTDDDISHFIESPSNISARKERLYNFRA